MLASTVLTFNVSVASVASSNPAVHTMSFEYLQPVDDDRDIETFNIDFTSHLIRLDNINLSLYLGITGTYAHGSITQLEGSLGAGTLKEVHLANAAYGLGPGLLMKFKLLEANKLSAHLQASGHLMIYNERFPAGGDYYNYMWRGGPLIEYEMGGLSALGLSYQRAHVSNGQGLTARNPSYNAHGFALRYTGIF